VKIYHVIQIKLSQLVYENIHGIINLDVEDVLAQAGYVPLCQTTNVFKWQQSNKHFQEFYLQDGGENHLA